jgi:hypothetical protein
MIFFAAFKLTAQTKSLNQISIFLFISALNVVQQMTTLTNHGQQTTA